jgi:GGDEF domain-containing protein
VVVVEPEPDSIQVALHRTVQEVQQAMMTRYVITSLARVFNKVLRRIDVVIEQREQGRFVILCPETNATGSNVLADRIQAAVAEQLGVSVKCGTASFPDEALTFEELVRQAESHLQQPAELPERANPTPTEVKGMP